MSSQDTIPHEYALETNDEDVAEAFIAYLQTGDYENSSSSTNRTIITPMHHAKVMNLAFKYKIKGLGRLTYCQFLERSGSDFWKTEEFVQAIRQAYETDSDELSEPSVRKRVRRRLVNVSKDQKEALMGPGGQHAAFKQIVRSTPEFAFDLLKTVVCPTPTDAHQERSTVLRASRAGRAAATISNEQPPSLKRKRAEKDSFSENLPQWPRKCTIWIAPIYSIYELERDDIYERQCRTCADQLERRINYDKYDAYGRRLF